MTPLQPPIKHAFNEDDAITSNADAMKSDSPSNNPRHLQDKVQSNCSSLEVNTSLDVHVRSEMESDSRKRKPAASGLLVSNKKPKLDNSQSSSDTWPLSAEVWQRIFTFLPPKMLGRLLSINKYFHFLLNPESDFTPNIKPEVIWQISRRRFWPSMPTPLRGQTELRMWQLSGHRCQFCGTTDQFGPTSPFHLPDNQHKHVGPRPIWSFALRSCGRCLSNMAVKVGTCLSNPTTCLTINKEIDLLLSSSTPSCLIPGLPFIFIDDNMQITPSALLQTRRLTLELSLTKLFLSSHLRAIQEEFMSVRAMGEATAEEWLKGLEERGRENRADSLRWEKFELSGGLTQMRQSLCPNDTVVKNTFSEAFKGPVPSTSHKPIKQRGNSVEVPRDFGAQSTLYTPSRKHFIT